MMITTSTATPNAIYTEADDTVSLVVLDSEDCVAELVVTDLTAADVDDIYAGETSYRVLDAGYAEVEVGDGDTFRRLVLR